MSTISSLAKRLEKLVVDNSPTILTAIGVTGALTTAYLTGRASYFAADEILYAERGSIGNTPHLRLDAKAKIKLTWKLYIPAAATATLTVAAIIGANRIGSRRAAALAAAYSVTEKAFTEYREKIVDKIGEKKEQQARDEIAQERVLASSAVVISSDEGLCYEVFTDRYFEGDIELLRRAENDLNRTILHDGYASLTDFYHLIGLKTTALSDEVGWTNDSPLDLKFSAVLGKNNRPCLAVDYRVAPIRNYHKFG